MKTIVKQEEENMPEEGSDEGGVSSRNEELFCCFNYKDNNKKEIQNQSDKDIKILFYKKTFELIQSIFTC